MTEALKKYQSLSLTQKLDVLARMIGDTGARPVEKLTEEQYNELLQKVMKQLNYI